MKKTALQNHIERLEQQHARIPNSAYQKGIEYAIQSAKELLEKEKQMVVDAYEKGSIAMSDWYSDPSGRHLTNEQYFNENYDQ